MRRFPLVALLASVALTSVPLAAQPRVPAQLQPDRSQPIDAAATAKIREYTTAPEYNSPLTDYLPLSATVPSPSAVLGDVAGAPGMLPYSADVHRYFRMLDTASERVEVVSIGTSEEGRERIAVAISSEGNLRSRAQNDSRLAQLADPRTLGLDDQRAEPLIAASVPVYYITGALHSPETGSPTALMELAYRLAVDESPYVRAIRESVITLITPVVEVDGRDRMVDVYRWHLAHPGVPKPDLAYWGHYVAHDNNRDAMGLTLSLSRNVLDTYVGWHAQVLHDLHESVPLFYDNTVGDGPYNAWVDPILTSEWQLFGWSNVAQMTKFGMPGVFTHGYFDTWSPGYLMFLAAMHNGVSRLYETFGNGGADTEMREIDAEDAARTWYRPNPPPRSLLWSQRNNNNYQQTALLVALAFAGDNRELLLRDFWAKSKRSIEKPKLEGPAAWVLPGDERRAGAQAELLRVLAKQHVEVSRAERAFTVTVPSAAAPASKSAAPAKAANESAKATPASTTSTRTFPAGSYIVRMDQPYSRVADVLLDRQYWSPDDPQKNPFDDTGWTFGELFDVQAVRVTDAKVLDTPMVRVQDPGKRSGGVIGGGSGGGSGSTFLIAQQGDDAMFSLRYALGDATVVAASEAFRIDRSPGRRDYPRGSWLVSGIARDAFERAVGGLGVDAQAVASPPSVATRKVAKPRIALLHSWLDTQTEGWWRQRLDLLQVPYDYISTQDVAAEADLRARYDVILFPPVGVSDPQRIVTGLPMWGGPLPWEKSELTPNLGSIDATADMRPGLGFSGLEHLRVFVERGGLLVAVDDTARLFVRSGFAPGVRIADTGGLKVVGTVLDARFPKSGSPVVDGFGERLSVYSAGGMAFELSNLARGGWPSEAGDRPSGRGTADDADAPQGRPPVAATAKPPKVERWEARPLGVEELRDNPNVIPEALRPRTLVRFGDADGLLISGLLDHGGELAGRPAVVDVPIGDGHLLLFAINPIWRGSTIGSHPLVWNAVLRYDSLGAIAPPLHQAQTPKH